MKSETGAGSPATVIIERADEWGADLIVVGSHGRTALGRFFCRIEEPDTPVRLIIGIDGSEDADAAVDAVAARKWLAGGEARIVSATWAAPQVTSQRMVGPITNWILEEKARVKKMIAKGIDKLTAAA